LPVLDVLSKGDITDALLIAVRYYGGILLGTGGLVRAYSKTAGAAVRAAGLLRMSQRALYTLHLPYNVYESFVHWCGRREIAVTDTTFAADVGLQLAFSPDLVDVFLEGVADFTGGTCVPDYIGREYIGLPLDREPVTEESTEDEYNP
jgi:putative IMPACT (imprinted ancient) family translation regulator